METRCRVLAVLLATLSVTGGAEPVASEGLRVSDLRCEYRREPLAVDDPAPRLSWTLVSPQRGQCQTAYRVLVAASPEALAERRGDLWDSGRVASAQSLGIPYAGRPLASNQVCHWRVRVWDREGRASAWSPPAQWTMGLLHASDWQGQWIGDGRPLPRDDAGFYADDPAPLFRREFHSRRAVRRARLHISSLGYYEARLNGRPVGSDHLDVPWTRPEKRLFYSTYEVSDLLCRGANCLAVSLGNGWYNPLPLRMWGRVNLRERLTVGRPCFRAQLTIEYTDGSRDTVASDAAWRTTPGPILRNNIYLGEHYDARREIPGWDRPGLDDRAWSPVAIRPGPQGLVQARALPGIQVTATVRPVGVTEPSPGTYVVDMGQNFAGWARLTVDVPRGTRIVLRYGELLHDDGTLNPLTSVCGQIKRDRPGADGSPAVAWQTDTYLARGGGSETYCPRFTFHAFRYLEITGLPAAPRLDAIVGLRLNSAVEPVGSFACSNDRLNRIQRMCRWTFLSNLFGVQSDCPHRERFGYGGDLVVTCDALMLNYDMAAFYAKATRDWQDSALADGRLTDTAPSVGIQYCGVGWAMAHPLLQQRLYRYYGDRRLIEEQYPVSRRWLERMRALNPDSLVQRGLPDHEALVKETPAALLTPLYAESARLLARLAAILGREEDTAAYGALAHELRTAYTAAFLDAETGVVGSGTQGAQVLALALEMLPVERRPAALDRLLRDIGARGGHLSTGIFGTRYLLEVLSRAGRADVAYALVDRSDFPGWGYMLERGATTLWEHWQFSDNTFSHNHPMFGSVSQWFYNWLGGIEPAADARGCDRLLLHPQFVPGLDWVRCAYRSVRGPVRCDWRRDGDRIVLTVDVPVGATALLALPSGRTVTEGGRPLGAAPGVAAAAAQDGHPTHRLGSGHYVFELAP